MIGEGEWAVKKNGERKKLETGPIIKVKKKHSRRWNQLENE